MANQVSQGAHFEAHVASVRGVIKRVNDLSKQIADELKFLQMTVFTGMDDSGSQVKYHSWDLLGYETWTAMLEGEFTYSRSHLYKLMRAARVNERLEAEGQQAVSPRVADMVQATVTNPDMWAFAVRVAREHAKDPERLTTTDFSQAVARRVGAVLDEIETLDVTAGYTSGAESIEGEARAFYKAVEAQKIERHTSKRQYLLPAQFLSYDLIPVIQDICAHQNNVTVAIWVEDADD